MSFERPDEMCTCEHPWRYHAGMAGDCAVMPCKCKAYHPDLTFISITLVIATEDAPAVLNAGADLIAQFDTRDSRIVGGPWTEEEETDEVEAEED